MTAGHVVILSLISLIFVLKTVFAAGMSIPFALFVYCLEILVGFLQAFIFTVLSSLFIGLAWCIRRTRGDPNEKEDRDHARNHWKLGVPRCGSGRRDSPLIGVGLGMQPPSRRPRLEGMARQPQAAGTIQTAMLIAAGFIAGRRTRSRSVICIIMAFK